MAVILPLLHGLSLRETASTLGRSHSWVATQRRKFIADPDYKRATSDRHGGRRNEIIPLDQEDALMDSVCEHYVSVHRKWRSSWPSTMDFKEQEVDVTFVIHVQRAMAKAAGRPVSKASAYNLMARVGRRRFELYEAWMWTHNCL